MSGWIGVDLDGTLARYDGWRADGSIGEPISVMVARVLMMLLSGMDVRIFTARIWPIGTTAEVSIERLVQAQNQAGLIFEWCEKHLGQRLPVTCIKDYGMIELWDDRAVQVIPNTGKTVSEAIREEGTEGKKP